MKPESDQPHRERNGPTPPLDIFPEIVPDEEGLNKLPREKRVDPGVEDGWRPSIDIAETATTYLFFVEAPGIKESTISVELFGEILSIFVEKELPQSTAHKIFHKVERDIGSSFRSFRVPKDATESSPEWTWEKGVLEIELQRSSDITASISCVAEFEPAQTQDLPEGLAKDGIVDVSG